MGLCPYSPALDAYARRVRSAVRVGIAAFGPKVRICRYGGVMPLNGILAVVNSLVTLGLANTVATIGGSVANVNIVQ